MNRFVSTRNPGWDREDQVPPPRIGRHARPAASPNHPRDRSAEHFHAANRALTEAQAGLRGVGADPDAINTAFAIARDCLGEAWEILREVRWETRRELAIAHSEREQADRGRQNPAHCPDSAAPVVLDAPGLDLCPDPRPAQTPAQYMDTLRNYRIWAGQPSYRAMGIQCAQRFAASTIHAALSSNELPSLPMVQAIITACGGTNAHQQMFTTAWRQLRMPQEDPAQPSGTRTLYSVGGGTAQ